MSDREEFAAVVTHDLQEPLRQVAGFTQLLAKRLQGSADPKVDEYMGSILDGVGRMRELVQAWLQYAKTGVGRFGPVDCGQAVWQALANLAALEGGAEILCGPLPTVLGDEVLLVQLFQNLIGNALKFHGKEAPRVRVEAERQGAEWVVSVADNGIGIPEEFFGRIFEIFERLHGPHEIPGTGAGLAICRKIVELHGGRIWVESR
ncbi:MAG: sensor protein, partial [Acidobacteria bacterium]|nr:sensor protein [Acidobacteriota bacterium]